MKAYARLLYRRVIQRFSKTHEDLGRYFKLLIPILLTCFVSLKGLIFYWTPESNIIKQPNILPPYIPKWFSKLPRSNEWINRKSLQSTRIVRGLLRSRRVWRTFVSCPMSQQPVCNMIAECTRNQVSPGLLLVNSDQITWALFSLDQVVDV